MTVQAINFESRARILQQAKLKELTKNYPNVFKGLEAAMEDLNKNGAKDTFTLSIVTPEIAARYNLTPGNYLRAVLSEANNIKRSFTELTGHRLEMLNDNVQSTKNFITRNVYAFLK